MIIYCTGVHSIVMETFFTLEANFVAIEKLLGLVRLLGRTIDRLQEKLKKKRKE